MDCQYCRENAAARARWGKGPWDNESDFLEFYHSNLPCLVHRGMLGAWSGFVGVGHKNKFFKKEVHEMLGVMPGLKVAGRVNYTYWNNPHQYTPPHGHDKGIWWIGFDFALYGQGYPAMWQILDNPDVAKTWRYWGADDVIRETFALADQLALATVIESDAGRSRVAVMVAC